MLRALLLSLSLAPEISTLPNGLTIVVDRVADAPGVAVVVAARCGSADDTPHAGLAHYLEHILFKGTEKYGVGRVHAEIESRGGEFNAFTAQDYTAYWVEIPREHAGTALEVLSEATLRPTFPIEEVEKERTVIQEERRRRADNPATLLWDRLGEAAFRIHPYGVPGVGTETSIDAITQGEMAAFHAARYVPRNMLLAVVGDVEPAWVRAEAERLFSTADVPPPPLARGVEPAWTAARRDEIERPLARTYWALALQGPSSEEDPEANAALDLAAGILAGGRASILHRRLVDDLRIADGVSATWSTSRDPDLFVVTGISERADLPFVERVVRRAVLDLARSALPADEVSRARTRYESDWIRDNESPRSRAFRHAFYWAEQGLGEADRYLDRLGAHTPESIRRAMAALAPERGLFFSVGPGSEAVGGETAVLLSNGMRILLRPAPGSGVVAMVLGVAAGQTEEEIPGTAALLAAVLPRGSGGRKSEALDRAWEGAGLIVSAAAEPDLFSITAVAPAHAAGLALRAVGDLALEADLPLDEISAARERTLRGIRAKRDDAFSLGLDRLRAVALGGPYANPVEGDETSVRSLTREDLVAFRRDYLVPARSTLVVEGDFDPGSILTAVRSRFGRLPAVSGARRAAFPDLAAPREVADQLRRPGAQQGLLLIGWRAPAAGDESYARWKVANALLGGASQARLFRHLRDDSGLAYAVGSFFPTRRGPSLLTAYLGTDPANLAETAPSLEAAVRATIFRLAEEMSEEELAAAKEKVVGDYLLDHQTAARRAWYRSWFESVGVGADFDATYPARVREVTIEEARGVVREILSAPSAVVRILPEE